MISLKTLLAKILQRLLKRRLNDTPKIPVVKKPDIPTPEEKQTPYVVVFENVLDLEPKATIPLKLKNLEKICWHFLGTPDPVELNTEAKSIRYANIVQVFHQITRGWLDIAYNCLITPQGKILNGRGIHIQGGAQRGNNKNMLSVCLMVSKGDVITAEMIVAMKALAKFLEEFIINHTGKKPLHICHKDLNLKVGKKYQTDCPGQDVERLVRMLNNG